MKRRISYLKLVLNNHAAINGLAGGLAFSVVAIWIPIKEGARFFIPGPLPWVFIGIPTAIAIWFFSGMLRSVVPCFRALRHGRCVEAIVLEQRTSPGGFFDRFGHTEYDFVYWMFDEPVRCVNRVVLEDKEKVAGAVVSAFVDVSNSTRAYLGFAFLKNFESGYVAKVSEGPSYRTPENDTPVASENRLGIVCLDRAFKGTMWDITFSNSTAIICGHTGEVVARIPLSMARERFQLPSFWQSVADFAIQLDDGVWRCFKPEKQLIRSTKDFLALALGARGAAELSRLRRRAIATSLIGLLVLVLGVSATIYAAVSAGDGKADQWEMYPGAALVVWGLALLYRGISTIKSVHSARRVCR